MSLFAKLIFPPFMWKPASERESEGESDVAGVRTRQAFALVWKEGEREACSEGSLCLWIFRFTGLH